LVADVVLATLVLGHTQDTVVVDQAAADLVDIGTQVAEEVFTDTLVIAAD
jgi:hypothetical protein